MALENYKTLTALLPEELDRLVLAAAAEGYLPLGGIQIDMRTSMFAQTMLKGDVAGGGGAGGSIPDAGVDTRGLVLQGAAVADATDEASAVTQLNVLLAALRASGALAS